MKILNYKLMGPDPSLSPPYTLPVIYQMQNKRARTGIESLVQPSGSPNSHNQAASGFPL